MTALDAVADVAPLLTALGEPRRAALPVAAADPLGRLTSALGLPDITVVDDPDGLDAADLVLTRRLARVDWTASWVPPEPPPAPVVVTAPDGAPLNCHLAGDGPPVVLVSACGMPAGLVRRWVAYLSRAYRVLTWETRGLFDRAPGFDTRGTDLATQAADLVAVLDAFDLREAHVVGLCGGAPVALAAAAVTDRIGSLGLWHGDYELGDDAPKTTHQRDVQGMLAMAARSREKAAGLHAMFRRPAALAALRPDLAHYLYYPYATAELLYRYGLLNGAIMTTDCRPLARAVTQPALVVTSRADTTAHPAGSAWVAAAMPHARLVELPEGDHLSAFDADAERLALAERFITETGSRA